MLRPTHLLAASAVALGLLPSHWRSDASAQPAPQPTAQPAPAHGKTPSPRDLAAARRHFEKAEAAKARGEYQTAAVEYLAAYELFQEPAFFYNIAEVYRLAGDEKNALVYYQKYLELDPRGKGAESSRVAAEQLRRSIAAKEDAARLAAEAEIRRKADAEADARRKAEAAAEAKRKAAIAPPAAQPRPDQPAESPGNGRGLRLAGLVTAGVGIVAIGVGLGFGAKARSISDQASRWDTFDRERYDEGKAAERTMFVFTGIGAAALVTGGVLYYVGHRAKASSDTGAITLAPMFGRSQIAFAASGQF